MKKFQVRCPYCTSIQKDHCLIRSWKYGFFDVMRFECKCGKDFNFYNGPKSYWTIPKSKS